jgi:hypothetical protein
MGLLVLLGLKKKTAVEFNQQKSKVFDIFLQTRDKLLKLITEQQIYVDEQTEIKIKAQKEIELTKESMRTSDEMILKLENFIN